MVRSYCCRARAVAKTAPRPVDAPVTTARRRLVSCTVAVCAMRTPPQAFPKTPLLPCMRRSVEYVRTSLVVQEQGGDEAWVTYCPWLIRHTKSAIILQSAWSGQGVHLCCPRRERRMHTRDCVLAEGACRVA